MKILLISDAHRIGGAEHYLFLLAKGLQKTGYQVELICPKSAIWLNFIKNFTDIGITVHPIKLAHRTHWGHLYFLGFLNFPQIFRVKNMLTKLGPDVLHVNTANIENGQTIILGAHLARLKNIVTTVHTSRYLPFRFKNVGIRLIDQLRAFIARMIASNIQKIIAISQNTADELIKRYRIDHDKFRTVYNGVEIEESQNASSSDRKAWLTKNSINENRPVILCVASLSREKGIAHLLEAIKQLKEQGYSFTCLTVGEGNFRVALENYTVENHLSTQIRFLGRRDDVAELMKISDLFVLPSFSEGFPFVLLEAMNAGLPVIATHVGGIPEMITHEKEGYLIPPRNTNAIVDAIQRLSHDKHLTKKIRANARTKVKIKFSLSNMITDTTSVYKEIAENIH
jgi:glycosyltransferase involved in cell wall biosynthesis